MMAKKKPKKATRRTTEPFGKKFVDTDLRYYKLRPRKRKRKRGQNNGNKRAM